LIPSYNTGPQVYRTVLQARAFWDPVWVVVDGSTDGTGEELVKISKGDPGLETLLLDRNQGKGAAVLAGLENAAKRGFTHVLVMDADGQHPAEQIPEFMQASLQEPQALIFGKPIFNSDAPRIRVLGRKVSNSFAHVETLCGGIGDSLYGFRVYPVAPLLDVMRSNKWMRRFDFDVEAAVRLVWRGLLVRNLPSPVRYLRVDEGGISHFKYARDNALLSWMHIRLLFGFLIRLPLLVARRIR
jgi:glycosyltransferase involved in cell wall biosynthesis